MSVTAKLYDKLLLFRIRRVLEKVLRTSQNGFRPHRSTVQHIISLRILCDTAKFHQSSPLVLVFIDFIKAFDSVKLYYLKAILKLYGIPEKLVNAIMSLYMGANAQCSSAHT